MPRPPKVPTRTRLPKRSKQPPPPTCPRRSSKRTRTTVVRGLIGRRRCRRILPTWRIRRRCRSSRKRWWRSLCRRLRSRRRGRRGRRGNRSRSRYPNQSRRARRLPKRRSDSRRSRAGVPPRPSRSRNRNRIARLTLLRARCRRSRSRSRRDARVVELLAHLLLTASRHLLMRRPDLPTRSSSLSRSANLVPVILEKMRNRRHRLRHRRLRKSDRNEVETVLPFPRPRSLPLRPLRSRARERRAVRSSSSSSGRGVVVELVLLRRLSRNLDRVLQPPRPLALRRLFETRAPNVVDARLARQLQLPKTSKSRRSRSRTFVDEIAVLVDPSRPVRRRRLDQRLHRPSPRRRRRFWRPRRRRSGCTSVHRVRKLARRRRRFDQPRPARSARRGKMIRKRGHSRLKVRLSLSCQLSFLHALMLISVLSANRRATAPWPKPGSR
jgi:hypothetical protein